MGHIMALIQNTKDKLPYYDPEESDYTFDDNRLKTVIECIVMLMIAATTISRVNMAWMVIM